MQQETAQTLALQALTWLAEDEDRLAALLWQSGLAPEGLRQSAGEPEVLAAILDHILAEDERVLAFCANAAIKPETVLAARAALPGGDVPYWT